MLMIPTNTPPLPAEVNLAPPPPSRAMMQTSFQRLVSRQLVVPLKKAAEVWP